MDIPLQNIIDRQIALSVEAVWACLHAGPDPKSISFRHILNRIMILIQSPVTFVLFQNSEGKRPIRRYTFNKHPRHASDINARAADSNIGQMFQLFGTEYYLLVLEAQAPYLFRVISPPTGESTHSVTMKDVVRLKLARITDEASYAWYERFKTLAANSIIACQDHKEAVDNPIQPLRLKESSDDYSRFLRTLKSNTTQYELDGYGVVDRVYRKIKKGIESISGSGERNATLTNFILFIRDYAVPNNYLRHGDYNYRLRILICSTQRSDLISFFEMQIKGDRRQLQEAKKKEAYLFRYELEDKPYFNSIAKAAARKFFNILGQPDGVSELLRILEAPFGITSRSMADPVFDGVTFFRDPFTQGGYNRCFPEGHGGLPFDELSSEHQDDVLRVTICRHLFDGMAAPPLHRGSARQTRKQTLADEKNIAENVDRLQIMLNPVELGGRVWCVIGHVTRSIKPEKSLTDQKTVDSLTSYWLENYHIYQTINERAKKNLRIYMSQLYEDTVGRVYKEEMLKYLGQRVKSSTIEAAVNGRLQALSCVFPYDVVKVGLTPTANGKPWPEGPADGSTEFSRRAIFSQKVVSVVSKQHNRVFPPAPGLAPGAAADFVSETDIAVAMSDAVLRGSIEAYGSQKDTK
jgi:hypothetical protein